MNRCAILFLLVSLITPSRAVADPFPDLNLTDANALREASRVLEEELKLAARPQTYILLDLATPAIQIKGRGVELYRLPVVAWSSSSLQDMKGTRRLIARPPVVRRKIDPTATVDQEPISLADMPVSYTLTFLPPLTIEVFPQAGENPLRWAVVSVKTWWRTFTHWIRAVATGEPPTEGPQLTLTVSAEHAQSFAWSLVDGMPLVIRRPTDK